MAGLWPALALLLGGVSIIVSAAAQDAQQAASAPAPSTAATGDYRDANYDYFVSGDPQAPRGAHPQAGVALMGGGGRVDSAFKFIASHAGGGHIVILRATHGDAFDAAAGAYGKAFVGEWGPVASAQTVVFRTREAAFDPRVIAIVRGADGIFLAGGDQGNYIRYWKGTPIQDALNAHIQAGRPIGGSSAGLAILGRYTYTSLDGGSMESKVALADPFAAGMTLDSDFLHVPGLDRVITDTHFSARSRLGRLIVFVARLNDGERGRGIVGLGIDEKTALLIGADGIGRLAPDSAGNAWLVQQPQAAATLKPGQPLTLGHVQVTRLDPSSSIDLASKRVRGAAAPATVEIVAGHPASTAPVQRILLRDRAPPDES
ncbi:MAG TPA: cyanophycinase [Dokdonella sp.]